jgi:hypothetical protein
MYRWLLILFMPLLAQADAGLDWSAEAEVGYGYDSNVAIDDVDINTSDGDQFTDLRVSGGLEYETEKKLNASLDLTLSEKRYDSFDEFNGRLGLVSAGLEKTFGQFSTGVDFRLVEYRLDNADFLSMWQAAPYVGFFPSKRTYARVTLEHSDETFDDSPDRDNTESRIGLLGYFFFNGLKRHLTLRVQYAHSNAESRLFDMNSHSIRLTYNHEFANGLKLKAGYRIQQRDYDELLHPVIGEHREDRRHRGEIALSKLLRNRYVISLEAFTNDFESNLQSADYDQHVIQISLKYKR